MSKITRENIRTIEPRDGKVGIIIESDKGTTSYLIHTILENQEIVERLNKIINQHPPKERNNLLELCACKDCMHKAYLESILNGDE